MLELAFQILATGLSIWDHEEKNKYVDELASLKQQYYTESNKDPSVRSDAVLDNIAFRVRILSDSWTASVGKSNAQAKS